MCIRNIIRLRDDEIKATSKENKCLNLQGKNSELGNFERNTIFGRISKPIFVSIMLKLKCSYFLGFLELEFSDDEKRWINFRAEILLYFQVK